MTGTAEPIDWQQLAHDAAGVTVRFLVARYQATEEDALDATATALLLLWKNREAIIPGSAGRLFHTTAYRALIDAWRMRRRRLALNYPLLEGAVSMLGDPHQDTEGAVVTRMHIAAALDTLADEDAALLLGQHDGYTIDELARQRGISASSVRMRIFRARKQFRIEWERVA